jgi:hypothetical protein
VRLVTRRVRIGVYDAGMNNTIRTLAVLVLTLTGCAAETECVATARLGMCVDVGGDVPVFRPCDQIDFVAEKCTFRVLDTTQIRALNQTMTEEQCQQIR